jgi:hypothetical protein
MRPSPQVDNLEVLAASLSELMDEVVVVGGAVVELLLTDPGSPIVRPTEDVDVIVDVTSHVRYYELEVRLRSHGFVQNPEPPVVRCRWFGHGLILDVMPTNPEILGFTNQWYESAIAHPVERILPSGRTIRIIDAPHFLATKLVAFESRGSGDLRASHDFEDIIVLANGRPELANEVSSAPPLVRSFLADAYGKLMKRSDLLEAVEGALAAYQDSYKRAEVVLRRFEDILEIWS